MRGINSRGPMHRITTVTSDLRKKKVKSSRKFKTTFHRDLAAMKHVWEMLRRGTITAFGEIGRQYH